MQTCLPSWMRRRDFLRLAGGALAGWCAGCATNPVTGRKQFMLVAESTEREIDRQNAPHQFSADYGALQNERLNAYLQQTCRALSAVSHRPAMNYTCRGVNAVYVNAYTFPAGSIAITRGMLLSMESEAELAAVLGHEIGHVCARHTAANLTRGMFASAVLAGATAFVQHNYEQYADLAAGLGMVAGGALLARYSRDDERQADALGLEYMTRAGYNPNGVIALMDILRRLSKGEPGLVELLFATHPMSEERYRTAVRLVAAQYADKRTLPEYRERYMDHTADIRKQADAIRLLQNGENALARGKLPQAAEQFEAALRLAPDDYAGLLLLAKCRLEQNQPQAALPLAESAKQVYPREAQAWHITGLACLGAGKYAEALENFTAYESLLPGNPLNLFFRGLACEKMRRREEAARYYQEFLQYTQNGEQAKHAYQRLVEWGYIRPPGQASQR